ncbi:MAG: phosphatase PAP2 family protein [Candidatus Neomarinimicrobiota bacterium]
MKSVRYHFDRLLLWYLAGIFAITFVGSYFGLFYLVNAVVHVILIIMVLRFSSIPTPSGPRAWLRWFYPLLLLIPLHYEIELVGTLFHSGATFDELVKGWDRWLFRGHPHRFLADQLPGPWWREIFHLFYLTYYFIVACGFWTAWRQGRKSARQAGTSVSPDFLRYAFVFLGTFLTYMFIFILFPVVGPLDDRFLRFHGQGLLGPFIDLLYATGDSAAGAFPSSHVGEAVAIYLLLRPRSPAMRAIFIAVIMGLTISTIYGSFHYAIDSLAGLVTGALFYILWSWIYRRLSVEPGTHKEASG